MARNGSTLGWKKSTKTCSNFHVSSFVTVHLWGILGMGQLPRIILELVNFKEL